MPDPATPLTHARIAKFYIPLALSWIFMAIESPVCVGVLSRLPAAELNTAAFNILMSLALFIESPVIDLLSTSTTLSKNYQDFAVLSRFVWILMLGVAVAHALIVLTPLYYVVTLHVMGVPNEVAHTARLGLALMIPWAPSIAWRRYRQGLLIRYHRTRMVGFGTLVRVSTIITSSTILYFATKMPGIMIVATALICSVFAEALFAQWASRDVVRELAVSPAPFETEAPATDPLDLAQAPSPVGDLERLPKGGNGDLTMRKLTAFHWPLTLTTMVVLIGGPVVSAFLSKAPDPVLALASWQVAFSLLWLFRTVTFALPEVVITLYKDEASARKLRDFCMRVGLVASGIAMTAALLKLDVWFFTNVYHSTPRTAEMAHLAFLAASPLGLINAMQSYVRGMLTAHHLNVARFTAVAIGMATMVASLALGLLTPWRGVLSGAVAMNVALVAELAVLVWSWRRGKRLQSSLVPV
ncbi:MAG: hypothetical protein QOJ65_2179 [Fimbriimonadaceae bacterium]|nr:hypothetical protein [Fimbriimonadaceae bacterium]